MVRGTALSEDDITCLNALLNENRGHLYRFELTD